MVITQIIMIGILFSLLSTLIVSIISHREFFAKAIESYRELSKIRVSEESKDKRSLRKLRKIKSELRRVRQRLTVLFLISMIVFIFMYLITTTIIYFLYPGKNGIILIPFAIPLLSYKIEQQYYTHAIVIGFLSFMMPSYLFARIIKFK